MAGPRRQGRRALYGALIMLVLLALALGIFFLDNVRRWLRPSYNLTAVFATAPGLREGDDVWVAGVAAGKITRIELLPPRDTTARVAISLHLERRIQSQVRRDSKARLTTVHTLGAKVLEILPGSPRARVLHEGDTVYARPPLSQAEVADRARVLLTRMDSLGASISVLSGRASARLAQYARLGAQASAAQAELASLTNTWSGGAMAELLGTTGADGAFGRLGRSTGAIADELAAAQDRFGRFSRQLGPPQQRLGTDVAELQRRLRHLRSLIEQGGGGTLPRFRSDSALIRAIHGVQIQLDSLVAETRKNPARFVF
ncbi:MAG TPA: MlaD family protein [Longimicrobiales bacterium]|nr:MlaD family protein [Longimicrobiales bacterium]